MKWILLCNKASSIKQVGLVIIFIGKKYLKDLKLHFYTINSNATIKILLKKFKIGGYKFRAWLEHELNIKICQHTY